VSRKRVPLSKDVLYVPILASSQGPLISFLSLDAQSIQAGAIKETKMKTHEIANARYPTGSNRYKPTVIQHEENVMHESAFQLYLFRSLR
jgi:hypothetical protein